jgi:hypothetical protein
MIVGLGRSARVGFFFYLFFFFLSFEFQTIESYSPVENMFETALMGTLDRSR